MTLHKNSDNGKYGLLDADKNVIAPPIYDYIFPFVEDYAVVSIGAHLNGDNGVIDSTGKVIIPVKYRQIHFQSEGHFAVYKTYSEGAFFDTKGKQVSSDIPLRGHDALSSLKEGLARLEQGFEQYIFIDVTGKQAIPQSFQGAGLFCDGLARVQVDFNSTWGFIDKKGTLVVPCKYPYVMDFNEGIAPVSIDNGDRPAWGYINTKGEEIIAPQYDHVSYFHQGRAVVSKYLGNYKYEFYLIDTEGNIIEQFENNAQMNGYNYHIITQRNGKQGIISTKGDVLLPFEYDYIGHEFCGMRTVKKEGLEGLINMNNEVVVPIRYQKVHVSSASGVHNKRVRVYCYGDEFYFTQNEVHRTTIGVENDGKFGGFPYITHHGMYYSEEFIPISYARKGLVDKIGEYYVLNGCSFPMLDILAKLQSTDKNEVSLGKDLFKTVNYLMETEQVQGIYIDTNIVLPIAIQWATSALMNERIMSAHLIKALFLNIKKNNTPLIPLAYNVYSAFESATAKKPFPLQDAFEIIVPDYGFTHLFYPFTTNGKNYEAFVASDWSVQFSDEDGNMLTKIPKGTDKALEKSFKELTKTYKALHSISLHQFNDHKIQGKTWSVQAWKALFLHNPFYFNLALSLNWQTQSGVAFTLAEDKCMLDANSEEIEISDNEWIGLI